MNLPRAYATVSYILLLLVGCSSINKQDHIEDSVAFQQQAEETSLFDIRNEASTLFNEIERKELAVYTPQYYAQAQSAYSVIDDPSINEAAATIQLNRIKSVSKLGFQLKPKVEKSFKGTALAFKRMLHVKLQRHYPAGFGTLSRQWYQLVNDLAYTGTLNDTLSTRAQKLEQAMDELVRKNFESHLLEPSRQKLQALRAKETPKTMPIIFEEAQQAVKLLEDNLIKHADNLELIIATHDRAQRMLKRASNLNATVQALTYLTPAEAEQQVLRMSDLLHQIGSALGEPDHRHLGLTAQAAALTQAAEIQRKRAQAFANDVE